MDASAGHGYLRGTGRTQEGGSGSGVVTRGVIPVTKSPPIMPVAPAGEAEELKKDMKQMMGPYESKLKYDRE